MTHTNELTAAVSQPVSLAKYLTEGENVTFKTLLDELNIRRQQGQNVIATLQNVTGIEIPRTATGRQYTTTLLDVLKEARGHGPRLNLCLGLQLALARRGYTLTIRPQTLNGLAEQFGNFMGDHQALQDTVAQLQDSINALQKWQKYVNSLIDAERAAELLANTNPQTASITPPQAGPAAGPADQGPVDAAVQSDDTATGRSDDTVTGGADNTATGW
jgi:hypothetical protein